MITSVKVLPGCISCRNCENVCPKIFKVDPTSKVISHDYEGNDAEILMAEAMCPVQVIKVEKTKDFVLSFKKAKVLFKKMLNPSVLEITFETDEDISYKPGQYISLQAKDLVGKFSRSYSLASTAQNTFTLTVKILEKGRGSKFLQKLKIGKSIEFLGPLGNFYLQNTQCKKVFIATGTGFAPMIAMLENTPDEIKKLLIFGVRHEEDFYYLEKLSKYKNLEIITLVSRPGVNYTGKVGRVTDALDGISPNDEVYICGNPDMVAGVKKILSDKKHPTQKILSENFTTSRIYRGRWRDIILSGNIPGIEIFSHIIIILALIGVPLSWWYNFTHENMYGNFLGVKSYWSFMLDVSWWSVVFVMLIRPMSDVFPKLGFLRKLTQLRKAFGILSAIIIVIGVFGPMIYEHFRFFNYFTSKKWSFENPISIVYGLSEITALLLLITSSTFAQKKLGVWWKRIQRSSYVFFITGGIAAAIYFPYKVYPFFVLWGIVWILAKLKIKIWK